MIFLNRFDTAMTNYNSGIMGYAISSSTLNAIIVIIIASTITEIQIIPTYIYIWIKITRKMFLDIDSLIRNEFENFCVK